jgi:DegV family protein with EDD domain
MLRVVMDSAGDLPPEWLDEYQIDIIPVNIHFGERTYLQGVDLSNAEFYRMARESKQFPKTAQPSPQQFIDFYKRIAQPGDTILSMHVTGKLSGTFASAQMAARELLGKFNIIALDSGNGSAGLGFMCRDARILDRKGTPIEQIVARMEEIKRSMNIVLTLKTMEFARRSGRVKALQAALASVLDVKPVIVLKDGMLDMGQRVRTRRKALEATVETIRKRVGDALINAAAVQAEDPESGQILTEMVRSRLNVRDLIMTELSIGVAANLGPGTVGVAAYPVEAR